jgi:hypothetical protein
MSRAPASVDPFDISGRMTRQQLEWWILFGICVAGKRADQTEAKLDAFLADMPVPRASGNQSVPLFSTPFARVRYLMSEGKLLQRLRKHRLGKYSLLRRAFPAAVDLDLDALWVESLEQVPGIGPKTARMIVLYSRPDASVVPLDTHVLKWLRSQGYDAPKATPTGRRYLELEKAFVDEARRREKTVRQLDTEVWQQYARKGT